MSGTPSGAANAAGRAAASGSIEDMLQELMARQARDAAAITNRLDAMQAEIDSRAPAIDALHAGAAAPGATALAASRVAQEHHHGRQIACSASMSARSSRSERC